ncbi:hypothetical protein BDV23DRAFT_154285 [Aspergillus alliaceus]|uniref:Uncharacterized protein n=1 Tax=Petromyces alliaceus TaxID=209559 RepID=A0A5N7CBK7_PETAA|nr:hypothetical protein BDV23DRAFT_154285 [Aspergillus alliaceus]
MDSCPFVAHPSPVAHGSLSFPCPCVLGVIQFSAVTCFRSARRSMDVHIRRSVRTVEGEGERQIWTLDSGFYLLAEVTPSLLVPSIVGLPCISPLFGSIVCLGLRGPSTPLMGYGGRFPRGF